METKEKISKMEIDNNVQTVIFYLLTDTINYQFARMLIYVFQLYWFPVFSIVNL